MIRLTKLSDKNVVMTLNKIIMMIMIIIITVVIIIAEKKIAWHRLTASYNLRNTSFIFIF